MYCVMVAYDQGFQPFPKYSASGAHTVHVQVYQDIPMNTVY